MRLCKRLLIVITLSVMCVLLVMSVSAAGVTVGSGEDDVERAEAHFHVSAFNSYDGEFCWYCGMENLTADGGYGNNWTDYLDLPLIVLHEGSVTSSDAAKTNEERVVGSEEAARARLNAQSFPVVTFAYRCDTVRGDYSVLQCMCGGSWKDVSELFSGRTGTWVDIGVHGYAVATDEDNSLRLRFKVSTDDAVSDEDGGYDSHGGAFSVDNIRVYDFLTGSYYFFEGAESGGLCVPSACERG